LLGEFRGLGRAEPSEQSKQHDDKTHVTAITRRPVGHQKEEAQRTHLQSGAPLLARSPAFSPTQMCSPRSSRKTRPC
jgi:hypothetical protein